MTDRGLSMDDQGGPERPPILNDLPEGWDPATKLGQPGEFPFTRGVYRGMYLDRPWTIRQLAGYGTARDTNARYRMLLEQGATAINGVFDYPSLRAFGSDDERAASDVGRGGVAVDTVDDFNDLFESIPLEKTSVSLVSSQPIGAVPHLAMFLIASSRLGADRRRITGTSQNDFLMETAITIAPAALSPGDSFRLECDLAEFASRELPGWNPISISGYNYREAGANAALELALAVSHGIAVADELDSRGADLATFLPRLTFFLSAGNDFLEEIAKFRAARRIWSTVVRDRLGVLEARAQRFKFHTQTSGASNVAKFAHVNIARSAIQGLAAVLGGTQSLHINGYDEATSIPSEHAALTALRTQYVLLHESGIAEAIDPLAGSYYVEEITDQVESEVLKLVSTIDDLGGLVNATETGWVHRELAVSAYEIASAVDSGQKKVVGINVASDGEDVDTPGFEIPEGALEQQQRRLKDAVSSRNARAARQALHELELTCRTNGNVFLSVLAAVEANATLGEIGNVFRDTLGVWEFPIW